jgi:hypothetical protein
VRAVDEQGRHAHHAVAQRAHRQLLDAWRVHPPHQLSLKARHVEADAARVADELLEVVLTRMQKQLAVHGPEGALRGGGLGSLRGLLRVAVARAARHVPVDEA